MEDATINFGATMSETGLNTLQLEPLPRFVEPSVFVEPLTIDECSASPQNVFEESMKRAMTVQDEIEDYPIQNY